jgi:hypothetical protein
MLLAYNESETSVTTRRLPMIKVMGNLLSIKLLLLGTLALNIACSHTHTSLNERKPQDEETAKKKKKKGRGTANYGTLNRFNDPDRR